MSTTMTRPATDVAELVALLATGAVQPLHGHIYDYYSGPIGDRRGPDKHVVDRGVLLVEETRLSEPDADGDRVLRGRRLYLTRAGGLLEQVVSGVRNEPERYERWSAGYDRDLGGETRTVRVDEVLERWSPVALADGVAGVLGRAEARQRTLLDKLRQAQQKVADARRRLS